jgi:hypothetical protein
MHFIPYEKVYLFLSNLFYKIPIFHYFSTNHALIIENRCFVKLISQEQVHRFLSDKLHNVGIL